MSSDLGAVTPHAEHPASPVPLTEIGPLGDMIHRPASIKQANLRAHLKFENRSTQNSAKASNHLLYRTRLCLSPAILRETSG
jgi:hypothetical protein